jgi:hypothetical protein
MEDEYNSNPKDDLEERFKKIEAHIYDISHNMVILMSSLESKFGLSRNLLALTQTLDLIRNLKINKSEIKREKVPTSHLLILYSNWK